MDQFYGVHLLTRCNAVRNAYACINMMFFHLSTECAVKSFDFVSAVNCTEQSDCTVVHPLVGEQVILKCYDNNVPSSVWKWENELLYAGTTPVTTDNNIDLQEDTYSLNLHHVHISNDGRYVCKDNNGNHIDYCVEVLCK